MNSSTENQHLRTERKKCLIFFYIYLICVVKKESNLIYYGYYGDTQLYREQSAASILLANIRCYGNDFTGNTLNGYEDD